MGTPYDIQIIDEQDAISVDGDVVQRAVQRVLADASTNQATISIAIVGNQSIHELNKTYLQHDYATDVLSFVFDRGECSVDGEIVVSAEMAQIIAGRLNVEPHDELLLYIIHGALHLVGYDDKDEAGRKKMLEQEVSTLSALGFSAPTQRDKPIGTPITETGSTP